MSRRIVIAAIIALTMAHGAVAHAADAKRPLVLLFDASAGEGADKELAASAARAVRTYLRDTQRVEVTVFNRDNPTVLRAVMEKKLTADKVASYSSRTDRLEVAKLLAFGYAAGVEVTVKQEKARLVGGSILKIEKDKPSVESPTADKPEMDKPAADKPPANKGVTKAKPDEGPPISISIVYVKLWLASTAGGKKSEWEAEGSSTYNGDGAGNLNNAVQSAASSAVLQASRLAFADLPRLPEAAPTNGTESSAIGGNEVPKVSQPGAADYAAQAEESLKAGNLALAIQQYSRAVNASPNDSSLRIKLAETYARRAMYDEADDELRRAESGGADAGLLAAAKAKIDQMRKGQEPPPGTIETTPTDAAAEPSPKENKLINGAVAPAVAKMVEGDKLWNAGNPDEAAVAYQESIKLNPNDWRAHERLVIVDASMSLFGEARKALDGLNQAQPNPSASTVAKRYDILRKAFDRHFTALMKQYDSDAADFEAHIITRETYYNSVNGRAIRLEAMAKFLDALTYPAAKQNAQLRVGLACGLMAQACSTLLDYLETNSQTSKSNAATFAAQAKRDFEAATKLEEGAATTANSQ